MTSIASVLEAYGHGIDLDDFASQLDHAMRGRAIPDRRALSLHDRGVLTAVGVPVSDLDRANARSVVDQAALLLDANSEALPVTAAAAALGRTGARVRGAIADGSLYGIKVGRNWLIPTWQLDDAGPIPHLRKVIAAIQPGTSAIALARVMTQLTEELYIDGAPVSPRGWLRAGQPPGAVVALVEQLYAW